MDGISLTRRAAAETDSIQGLGCGSGGGLPQTGSSERLAPPRRFGSILRDLLGSLEIPEASIKAGSTLRPGELLGLQMRVHDAAFRMDLVSKVAESGLGAIRRFQNQ